MCGSACRADQPERGAGLSREGFRSIHPSLAIDRHRTRRKARSFSRDIHPSWGSAVFSNDKNRAPRRWRAVFHRDDGTGTHGFGRGVRLRPTGLRDRPVACRQAGAQGKVIPSPRTTGLCQPGESAFRTPTTRPRSSFQKGWAGTPCGRSSLPSVRPPSSRERVTQPQVSAPSKSSPRTAFRCVPPSPGCVPSGMPFSESRNRVCASCRGPPARPRRTQPPR